MSDYSGVPGSISSLLSGMQNSNSDAQNILSAKQAAARNGVAEMGTSPPANVQSFAGSSSNKSLNAANAAASASTNAPPPAPVPSNQMQQLTSAPAFKPTAPVGQNNSLNLNMVPNTLAGMVKAPNGSTIELSSSPPAGQKIGSNIVDPVKGDIGYGQKTQNDFFNAFKIDPAIGAPAWKSGTESADPKTPADYENVMKAMKQMRFASSSPQDAMSQWQSLRNSAAQTSLAAYQQSGGSQWGIPVTTLADGSQGIKLYSVAPGVSGNLAKNTPSANVAPTQAPPQGSQPVQAPGPTTGDTTVTPPTGQIDLSGLKNILSSVDLGSIGNLIGDYAGQGSRGKLAYAGDFNFRTPQELRQAQQNARESEILKDRGLKANQLALESAQNAPGGPGYQKLTNEQKIQFDKQLENRIAEANIQAEPGNKMADQAQILADKNNAAANSMARQAQPLALMQASNPYALYRTGEAIDANTKSGIRSLLSTPVHGSGSDGDKAEQLVSSWLGKPKPNAAGSRASVYDTQGQNVSNDLINGRKP